MISIDRYGVICLMVVGRPFVFRPSSFYSLLLAVPCERLSAHGLSIPHSSPMVSRPHQVPGSSGFFKPRAAASITRQDSRLAQDLVVFASSSSHCPQHLPFTAPSSSNSSMQCPHVVRFLSAPPTCLHQDDLHHQTLLLLAILFPLVCAYYLDIS